MPLGKLPLESKTILKLGGQCWAAARGKTELLDLNPREQAPEDHDLIIIEALYNKAHSLFVDGRLEEAVEAYDKALSIRPDYPEAWYYKGVTLYFLDRDEEAVEAYDKALEIKPDYPEAWFNKGSALMNLERYEDALEAYEKTLEIKPDYPEA